LQAAYLNDYKELSTKISAELKKDLDQQMSYYASLGNMPDNELEAILFAYFQGRNNRDPQAETTLQGALQGKQNGMLTEILQAFSLQQQLKGLEAQYKQPVVTPEMKPKLNTQESAAPKPADSVIK